ncbi:hypothetical protein D3C72_2024320 [compost metagenome]
MGDVRQVDVAAAVRDGHLGAVGERRVPAVRFPGVRLRHPQPQVCKALLSIVPVEIQPDAVAPLLIQVGVNIVLLPALDARGQGAVDFRARDFRRAEAVALGIGHPVDGDVQAGVAGSVVFHGGDDHAVPE